MKIFLESEITFRKVKENQYLINLLRDTYHMNIEYIRNSGLLKSSICIYSYASRSSRVIYSKHENVIISRKDIK